MEGEGGVLFISGEAGIGKTRLVRELITHARLAGANTLLGECYTEGGAPFSPISQILLSAVTDFSAPASFYGTSVALPNFPSLVLADLITLAPHLRAQYPDVPPNPQLDPQSERQRIFESFVQFCAALSAQTPLLVAIEDAHWADEDTLALLHYLARRVGHLTLKLLLVLTCREVELAEARVLNDLLADLNRERLATRLKLARLDHEQTSDLLAALFAEAMTSEFRDGIYLKTEGNPFFIEEVCKTLIEEGKMYRQGGRWQQPSMNDIQVPESIRMAVERRLSNLPAPTQKALLMSAIFGREFDFNTLKQASEQSEEALMDALEPAERAQMIGPVKHGGQMRFAFSHTLIPAALRESMGSLRRQRLHRRALAAIESLRPDDYEALAYHAAQGGDEGRARGYYTNAGDRALGSYAYHEAVNHYRAALALGGTEGERTQLSTVLGDDFYNCGRYGEAEQAYREAIRLAQVIGDDDALWELYARASDALYRAGDIRTGLDLGLEGLAILNGTNRPEKRGLPELLHIVGRHYNLLGQPEQARPLCDQALQIAERMGLVDLQVDVLATSGCLDDLSLEAQIQILSKAVELAKAAGVRGLPAWRARNNLAVILAEAGNYQAAVGLLRQTLEEAQLAGSVGVEAFSLGLMADGLLSLGELDAADELRSVVHRQLGQAGQTSTDSYFRSSEAVLAYYRGDVHEAIGALRFAREELQRLGDYWVFSCYGNFLADATLEVGNVEAAISLLQENHSLQERFNYGIFNVWTYCLLCAARLRQGDVLDAQNLLEKARHEAGPQPTLLSQSRIALAEARLASAKGRWTEALSAYEHTTQLEEQMGRRWYRAQTLREWAGTLLTRDCPGDRERANALLLESLSEFEAMHAPGYEEVVRKSLEALN
jgi:predicted ATPase